MLKEWRDLPDFDPAKLVTMGRMRLAEHQGFLVVSLEPDLPRGNQVVRLPPVQFLMEPALARKLAARLIAAADFLDGQGDPN